MQQITAHATPENQKWRILGQIEQQQATLKEQWDRLEVQRNEIIQALAPMVSPDAPSAAKELLERDPLKEQAEQDAAVLDVPSGAEQA